MIIKISTNLIPLLTLINFITCTSFFQTSPIRTQTVSNLCEMFESRHDIVSS